MTLFLILAPYGVYASLMLVTSASVSLIAAGGICLATIAFDKARGRSLKILPAGTVVLFAGIVAWLHLIDPSLSDKAVKVAVDGGILAISLGSLLARYPFTLQYATESVHPETAAMPGFLRANYIITSVWTASFLLMLLANAAILYVPGLPIWLGLAVAFAARNSAVYFTRWYPAYRRLKQAAPPPSAATLKFRSVVPRTCHRNFKVKAALESKFASAPLIPKFANKDAAIWCELRNRSTSALPHPH